MKIAPNISVGYIAGSGDMAPAAIEQLGAKLAFIGPDELAWGDLSKYSVIVTGVRAYERRADLRAYNHRLLDYTERGGTVIVQYNKMEFNQAEYGPYPAKVSGNRVCDETVPVKVLVPAHAVFNYPNKIGPSAWAGWVQERGLYFLGEKDPRYVDLVSMVDSFKDNPGEKRGAFVEGEIRQGADGFIWASGCGGNCRREPRSVSAPGRILIPAWAADSNHQRDPLALDDFPVDGKPPARATPASTAADSPISNPLAIHHPPCARLPEYVDRRQLHRRHPRR